MPPPREKKEKGGGRGEDKKKVNIERDIENWNELYLQPMPAKQQPHPPKGDGGERGKKREATGGEGRGNEKKMKIEEKIIDKVRGSSLVLVNNEGNKQKLFYGLKHIPVLNRK